MTPKEFYGTPPPPISSIQLFKTIDGDYFSILGLPLMPLLEALRREGAIDL